MKKRAKNESVIMITLSILAVMPRPGTSPGPARACAVYLGKARSDHQGADNVINTPLFSGFQQRRIACFIVSDRRSPIWLFSLPVTPCFSDLPDMIIRCALRTSWLPSAFACAPMPRQVIGQFTFACSSACNASAFLYRSAPAIMTRSPVSATGNVRQEVADTFVTRPSDSNAVPSAAAFPHSTRGSRQPRNAGSN